MPNAKSILGGRVVGLRYAVPCLRLQMILASESNCGMLLLTANNIHLERLHQRHDFADSASSRYLQRGSYTRKGNTVS
jgi:hypothetical protein